MADWQKVGQAGDVAEGEISSYQIGNRTVAVANIDGDLHSFDDICPHQQCALSEGEIDGIIIECPCHGSRFDVMTGEVVTGPATDPIDVFEAREEEGALEVALKEA